MPDIACVNGHFSPLAEAMVSVEDRGFQFGDGVYEVIRTYRGQPFAFDEHFARFERSAQALHLSLGHGKDKWLAWVQEGLRLSRFPETKMYLQVTRGQAPRDHPFPSSVLPTTVLTFRELHPLDASIRSAGARAITLDDIRWGRCDIKSVNLLANVLARQRAKEAGVFEAILVRNGLVTEGSVSNVMIVRNGVIETAPEGHQILSGVTRAMVLELARKEGLPVAETFVGREDLLAASEVFLTGTTVEVLPIVQVDGHGIGAGVPGPVSQRLARRWESLTG